MSEEGRICVPRQMDAQDVPMVPVMKSEILSIRFARTFRLVIGSARNVLYRGRLIAVKRMVKKRAIRGKA